MEYQKINGAASHVKGINTRDEIGNQQIVLTFEIHIANEVMTASQTTTTATSNGRSESLILR